LHSPLIVPLKELELLSDSQALPCYILAGISHFSYNILSNWSITSPEIQLSTQGAGTTLCILPAEPKLNTLNEGNTRRYHYSWV